MGAHKAEYRPNVPKIRQKLHNWPVALWERMEKAQAMFKIPVTDKEGKQVGLTTPNMDACCELWMAAFLDMFEQAVKQQERSSALVLTPDELRKSGAKLPNDLLVRRG